MEKLKTSAIRRKPTLSISSRTAKELSDIAILLDSKSEERDIFIRNLICKLTSQNESLEIDYIFSLLSNLVLIEESEDSRKKTNHYFRILKEFEKNFKESNEIREAAEYYIGQNNLQTIAKILTKIKRNNKRIEEQEQEYASIFPEIRSKILTILQEKFDQTSSDTEIKNLVRNKEINLTATLSPQALQKLESIIQDLKHNFPNLQKIDKQTDRYDLVETPEVQEIISIIEGINETYSEFKNGGFDSESMINS